MLVDAYSVAFRRDVDALVHKSFNDTIDVDFGIYKDGRMTVSLMPSDRAVDWKINLDFLNKSVKPSYAKMDSKVLVHRGFLDEWMQNRDEFFRIIRSDKRLLDALIHKGLYCVGRSKGASEAAIIGIDLVRNFYVGKSDAFLGIFEGAKTGNDEFCKSVERYIDKAHIYNVRFDRDIVTQLPPGFNDNPGIKIRLGSGFFYAPIVDHAFGCFCEERLRSFAETYDMFYSDGLHERVRIKS